jgi:hypothetical protein
MQTSTASMANTRQSQNVRPEKSGPLDDYSSRVPTSYCADCGKELDGATYTAAPGHVPKEGDFSVCIYCGCAMVYRADQTLRALTAIEWAALKDDERATLDRYQDTVQRLTFARTRKRDA